MLHKNPQKSPKKFNCKKCDYHCNNKKDFVKHLGTTKHKMLQNATSKIPRAYICEGCTKSYLHHSSYYRHKKNCVLQKPVFDQEKEDMKKEMKVKIDN